MSQVESLLLPPVRELHLHKPSGRLTTNRISDEKRSMQKRKAKLAMGCARDLSRALTDFVPGPALTTLSVGLSVGVGVRVDPIASIPSFV